MTDALHERALATGARPESRFVYSLCKGAIRSVLYPWCRTTVVGREHLSEPGARIIAPVHRSAMDIPLIGAASGRSLKYLAKDELFDGSFNRWLLSSLGGVPVRRGKGDRVALHASLDLLERGEAMMVFPEGTRQSGPTVGELFEGTAYLAAKTGAPVVPVGVGGTEGLLSSGSKLPGRGPSAIVAGPPMEAPTAKRSDRHAFTERLRTELQKLLDEAISLAAG